MEARIDIITLAVADLERALDFYRVGRKKVGRQTPITRLNNLLYSQLAGLIEGGH